MMFRQPMAWEAASGAIRRARRYASARCDVRFFLSIRRSSSTRGSHEQVADLLRSTQTADLQGRRGSWFITVNDTFFEQDRRDFDFRSSPTQSGSTVRARSRIRRSRLIALASGTSTTTSTSTSTSTGGTTGGTAAARRAGTGGGTTGGTGGGTRAERAAARPGHGRRTSTGGGGGTSRAERPLSTGLPVNPIRDHTLPNKFSRRVGHAGGRPSRNFRRTWNTRNRTDGQFRSARPVPARCRPARSAIAFLSD